MSSKDSCRIITYKMVDYCDAGKISGKKKCYFTFRFYLDGEVIKAFDEDYELDIILNFDSHEDVNNKEIRRYINNRLRVDFAIFAIKDEFYKKL